MKHLKNQTAQPASFRLHRIALILLTTAAFFFTGCQKDDPGAHHLKQSIINTLLAKAEKFPSIVVHKGGSIQAAIDAAKPNSVIKIEAGIYKEALTVNKQGIILIGASDGKDPGVIIENPGEEENGITVREGGTGFVLKNVNVKNFEENGVFLIRVNGFLLSHVTTIDNGEYGLFPIFCVNGLIEHCFASGHSDTGIYVGQSTDIDMAFNTTTANVNGLEIENCSGISASKNQSYDNVCGMLVVLLPQLKVKTSSDIQIIHNHIYDNNHVNFAEPGEGFESFVPSGSGILVVGTDKTTVKDNVVKDNHFVGIATVSTVILGSLAGIPPSQFSDIEPNPDGAQIVSNVVKDNGSAPPQGLPLPGVDLLWDGSGTNNCWSDNNFSTSYPSPLPACK